MLTYETQAEKDADKALLELARCALEVSIGMLRLDECGLWQLRGKRGRVTTWGDGEGYLLDVYGRATQRQDTWVAKRLAEVGITRPTGYNMFRLTLPVTEEQAALVRELTGLFKELSQEARAERSARAKKSGLGA